MVILWVDSYSEMGGSQHNMLEMCSALSSEGLEVVAAVPRGSFFDRLTAAGLSVFPCLDVSVKRRVWGFFSAAAKLLQPPRTVSQIIRDVKPDIIHANSLPAFLAACPKGSSIPVVWHVRNLSLPLAVACEAAENASLVIAASEAVDEYLVDNLPPSVLGRIRVVRDGIDSARFSASDKAAACKRFGFSQSAPVIGMVAHLSPRKRHDAFIRAAAVIRRQRPDAHFAVAGRDLYHGNRLWVSQLEAQVQQAGLAGCFHWIRDSDAPQDILPAFDLLLHPALNEPVGRVICEAMAAGVPVIAADSGGPSSTIQHRVSGILVRDGDPQRMAEEALGLLTDSALAARLVEGGLNRALRRFTPRETCQQMANEYRAILDSANVGSETDDD